MRKILSFFAAMLVAVAVNAQTDFAAPGYYCTADNAVLTGGSSSNFYLQSATEPHYVAWSDVSLTSNALATWTVTASRGCYVSVSLDLGPVIASNKHNFEVTIKDANSNTRGMVTEGGENTASEQVKALDGTILLPVAGVYTVEVYNNRDWGKGTIKNVILTYAADAPSEMVDVTSVALNKTTLPLEVEEVEQLTATVLPLDATDPSVTWTSSDPTIATVVDGFVTAIAAGNATITAKAGEQSATCAVTVSAATIPSTDFAEPYAFTAKKAHLDGAIWKMYKDDTYKLYGEGGHNKNYGTAIWNINVTRPCVLSGVLNGVEGGHIFVLDLYNGETLIGSLNQPDDKTWSAGEIALEGTLTIAAAGTYTLKLRNTQEWSSGKVAGVTLTYEGAPVVEPDYFLIGSFNTWTASDANYKFAVNPAIQGEYMLLGVALEANAEIKVISSTGTWYPDGTDNNKVITEAGTYDIYFRPDGQGGDDWHYHYFYVAKAIVPTAVAKDFEIDMQTDVFGGALAKYLYIDAENHYNYSDDMPAEYNAYFEVQGASGNHGYNQLVATVPVEVGEYKVTLGNCRYAYSADYTMAYVKSEDGSQTFTSCKQNYTQDEEGAVCYHQNPTTNVATMTFTSTAAQKVVIKCAHYTPYIKFEKVQGGTGIDNINVEKTVKTIENGQIVIIKNGVRYNALGAKL